VTSFLAIILLALAIWLIPHYYQAWRRQRLRAKGLTPEQQQLLRECLPFYHSLPQELQTELRANMSLFLRDKEFVGCNGLRVTEQMCITVAALACLLLLQREHRCYPDLHTVLLYPDTYVAAETHVENYVETSGQSAREGEAHYRGPVVLSWADIEQDMQHPEEGRNLVLHEFAHKLDEEDGIYNGRPVFSAAGEGADWAQVLSREFEALRALANREETEQPLVLDIYGAESPAEFFAVATEAFFMRAEEMRRAHPELYRQLRYFYRVDPASWRSESPPGYQYPR
jgi:hypothetical protein